jgi:hypothetical protein
MATGCEKCGIIFYKGKEPKVYKGRTVRMAINKKEKCFIGVLVSLSIGSILYLIFTKWIFIAIGLFFALIFLVKIIKADKKETV